MNRRTDLLIAAGWVFVTLLLGLAPMGIRASEQLSSGAALKEWVAKNNDCRGSQLDPEVNPACKRRDMLAAALQKNGYVLANHDVWVSPEQMRHFGSVVLTAGAQAEANPGWSETVMEGMLPSLRAKMDDQQIFAIWNDPTNREIIREKSPQGWALMNELMQKLAQYYSRSNNPALTLDY